MPSPSSRTVTWASEPDRSSRTSTRPCFGVNLIAFASRFQNTCCRRASSPLTSRAESSIDSSSEMPFAMAAGRTLSAAAFRTSSRFAGSNAMTILPVMIRDTSSRSSMRCICSVALRPMTSSARFVILSAGRSATICLQPRMALSGVRNSCDSTARKSSLRRLARSASSRAEVSRSRLSRSARSSRSRRLTSLSSARVRCCSCEISSRLARSCSFFG